ncbi:MAG: AbrB/MazE/SpoVT family DNA-binding domain-containing protein [Candidatus Odinarchaeota archaeon]|nr:AbrB/MazE/SpoVT family DNA-binding domain-containing protein [Candidatus Odinarchaeota archaeon]
MVKKMSIEIKTVDKQGRLVLPRKWRKKALKKTNLVLVIEETDGLKIIPFEKADLTKFFDRIDLGIDEIEDWTEFEKKFYGRNRK